MQRQIIYLLTCLIFLSCGQSADKTAKTDNSEAKEITSQSGFVGQTIHSESDCDNALKFANGYVDNLNSGGNAVNLVEWVGSNQLVTETFKTELSRLLNEAYKKDSILGLGFDPIFDAQDYPDEGFEIETIDTISNYIVLKGKDWNQFKIIIKLKYKDTDWFVDGSGIVNIPEDKQIKK
jgi:hypothetical protein